MKHCEKHERQEWRTGTVTMRWPSLPPFCTIWRRTAVTVAGVQGKYKMSGFTQRWRQRLPTIHLERKNTEKHPSLLRLSLLPIYWISSQPQNSSFVYPAVLFYLVCWYQYLLFYSFDSWLTLFFVFMSDIFENKVICFKKITHGYVDMTLLRNLHYWLTTCQSTVISQWG